MSYAHFLLEEDISDEEATEEILNDPEMMAAIQKGEEEIRQGKTIPWEDVQ
ncbi:MAG: hypothetical protein Q4D62_16030 [Planctomycetia bacterium]|nr:hypothetical protein [Planctomycetia bacterium]